MDKDKLGKRIAELRKEKGFSQKELAERLQVSPSAVCKWENGQNSPDILMAKSIADILEISCDELLGKPKVSEIQATQGKGQTVVFVCMSIALVLLAAVLSVVVFADKVRDREREADSLSFRIVQEGYGEDVKEGRVYELSIVYEGVPGEEQIFSCMSKILEDYRRGLFGDIDAPMIKCIFYDSVTAAEKGENTWIVSFLRVPDDTHLDK